MYMTEGNQYPQHFYPEIVTQHEKIALNSNMHTKFTTFWTLKFGNFVPKHTVFHQ